MRRKGGEELAKRVIDYYLNVAGKNRGITRRHFLAESTLRDKSIHRIIRRYEERGDATYKKSSGRPVVVATASNISRVEATLKKCPGISNRLAAKELGMAYGTVGKIRQQILGGITKPIQKKTTEYVPDREESQQTDFQTTAEEEGVSSHDDDDYSPEDPATFVRQININPCLLCWSPHTHTEPPLNPARLENPTSDLPPIIEEGVHVIFLLCKLLQLPSSKVEALLLRYGHPGGWITLCTNCDIIVKQARQLYTQIQHLQQQFTNLQSQVKSQLQVKQEGHLELDWGWNQRDRDHANANAATVEIRQYLLCPSPHSPEPVVGVDYEVLGDMEAESSLSLVGEIIPDSFDFKIENYEAEEQQHFAQLLYEEYDSNYTTQQINLQDDNNPQGRRRSRRRQTKSATIVPVISKKNPISANPLQNPKKKVLKGKPVNSRRISSSSTSSDEPRLSFKPLGGIRQSNKHNGHKQFVNTTSKRKALRQKKNHVKRSWSELVTIQKLEVGIIKTSLSKSKSEHERNKLKKELNSWSLKRLARKHRIKTFPCPRCEKIFETISAWSRHIRSCSVGKIGLKCQHCEQVVQTKLILELHMRLQHSPESAVTCNGCGLVFRTGDSNFESHVSSAGEHSDCHKNAVFCPYSYCSSVFPSEELLKTHQECIHSESKSFKCSEEGCGQFFTTLSGLRIHRKLHQAEDTTSVPFVCELCGSCFKVEHILNIHLEKVHSITDLGIAKFQCEICGKELSSMQNLTKHKRQVHEPPADPSFLCPVCGKRFKLEKYLNVHSRSHDPERYLKYPYYRARKSYLLHKETLPREESTSGATNSAESTHKELIVNPGVPCFGFETAILHESGFDPNIQNHTDEL